VPRPKGTRDADYGAKRGELLRGMSLHMMRRDSPRPSLRELAAAAGVSVPTLRHYFGARPQVIDAIFEDCLRLGREGLDAQRQSQKPFDESIHDYVDALIRALRAKRDVSLGDLIAVSLGEGLIDAAVSPSTLRHILDPTIEALEARLRLHIGRGEMIETDVRAAALMLVSPILLATLHQDQMRGAATSPIRLEDSARAMAEAFVRAYATSQAPLRPH
jgi:AcrR family transcriptional regulator